MLKPLLELESAVSKLSGTDVVCSYRLSVSIRSAEKLDGLFVDGDGELEVSSIDDVENSWLFGCGKEVGAVAVAVDSL